MKKFSLFLSAMLISMMSFAQGVTHDVVVENATTSPEGQNIVLSGIWEEKALTVMLWQGGATQGFGTYATDDYGPIIWGAAELTPKAEGVYTDKGDGTFTFTCTATDATDTYNISMKGANPAVEPEEPEAQYVDFYATAEFSDNIWAEAEDGTALDLYFAEDQPYNGEGTYTVTAIYSDAEWTEYNVAGSVTVEYDDVEGTEVLMGDLSTTDGSLNVHVVITKAGSGSVEGTPMEVNVTNLEVNYATTAFTGTDEYGMFTVSLVPNTNKPIEGKPMTFELDLENSSILYSMGWVSSPLTLVSGEITIDMNAPSATAIVTASLEDQTFVLTINMTATASESVDINLEATSAVVDEDVLTLYATYEDEEGNTFPVAVELQGFENVEGLKEYEAEEICKITIGDPNSEVETEFMDIAYANSVAVIIGEESENSISLEGDFSSWATGSNYYVTITGTLPVSEPEPALKGVVKRAVQLGESVVVLTHEADGTAHIYNVVDTVITEVSLEGVAPIDPENKGSYLAISDIAATEDGKLVAANKIVCQSGDDKVDDGYKRGEFRVYIWNDLAAAPAVWFTSKMSSNWYRSVQGQTIAYKGTSTNGTLFTTGVTATGDKFRYSVYNVIDGVYTDPAVNDSEHYHFTKGSAQTTTAIGANYEINVSPLAAANWILDGELVEPFEIVDPLTFNTEVTANAPLAADLGKKYNGASVVTVGEQHLMVAPYADAEGKLAGVKVLDITAGLDAATEVATADLDAAVEATAAATAVAVAENTLTITLVADATLHTLEVVLESEPEYPVMEDNITNLTYNAEEQSFIGGPSTQYGLEVFLVLGQDNLDGTFALDLEQSSIALNDNDLTILSGYVKDIDLSDLSAPAATAVIVAQLSESETYEFHLTMSGAPAETVVIVVEDALVEVEEWKDFPEAPTSNYALTMTADWTNEADGLTYPVKVKVLIYDPNVAEQPDAICNVVVGDLINDPWLGGVDGCYLTITTVEGVVTAKGVVTTSNGVALDLTISGKLPVEEPVKYTVTATVNPAETGTVTGAGEYEAGAEATLTATAAEGYEFVNWTVAGAEVATTATYTFTVTADVEVVANFKEITDAVDNIQVGVQAAKVLRNGQLIIIKNDVEYNAQGAVVK